MCHFATHSCSDSGCCCPSISFSIIKILIEFLYYLVLATGDDLCGVFHTWMDDRLESASFGGVGLSENSEIYGGLPFSDEIIVLLNYL